MEIRGVKRNPLSNISEGAASGLNSVMTKKKVAPILEAGEGTLLRSVLLPALIVAIAHVSFETRAESSCSSALREHDFCELKVSESRPTQFAVGFIEVREKSAKLEGMTQREFEKYLRKHPSPIVIGPGGALFITDGHHLGRAMFEIGRDRMLGQVIANFSDLGTDEFWRRMDERHWVYPFDENGQGPLDPRSLPTRLADLRDDIYRSLAGAVRDAGGYRKSEVYFADNMWANFFRPRLKLDGTIEDFRRAVPAAVRLARSPEAADMPGYIDQD